MHLFLYGPTKICLKLFYQPGIAGAAVFFRARSGILREQLRADAVELTANGGDLNEDLRAVRAGFHHIFDQFHMTDGPGNTVSHIVGIVLRLKTCISHLVQSCFQLWLYFSLSAQGPQPGEGDEKNGL
jgi:hypothetical protein